MAPRDPSWRRRLAPLPLILVAAMPALLGCQKFQARVELKRGNAFYATESYREALSQFQKGLELDPNATFAWRSAGLSAMALYRPGVKEPANEHYAEVAVDAFDKYLKAFPDDTKVEDYLVTVLVQAERYDDALKRIEAQAKRRPADADLEKAAVNILIRAGRLDEAMARARKRPDAAAFYTIGVAAWGRAHDNVLLSREERGVLVDLGLAALEESLRLKADDFDALVYVNLLYRERAALTVDPAEAYRWTVLADEWRAKALAIRESQAAAKPAAPASPAGG